MSSFFILIFKINNMRIFNRLNDMLDELKKCMIYK